MSLPYFPMFPSDFEAKTSHLTMAEDGAYNRLLRICWMTPGCTIPADDAWIMRRARAHTEDDKQAIRAVLSEFFKVENGRYSNARLLKEWLAANEAHERRKNAGAKGGKAKALKANDSGSSNALAKPKQPEPEPYRDTNVSHSVRSRPKPERFQDFWDQYPHRGGAKKNRKQAMAKYARAVASGVSEQTIISAAIRYASDAQVLRGYGRNPDVWLNNEGWNDDIEPVGSSQRGGNTGRSGPHDSLMAGFAAFANSDDDAGGSDFGGDQTIDGTCDEEMDSRSSGCGSKPVFRVIGSG